MKTFEEMVGKTFKFYGVNCNCFKLNTIVWEAIEDESDGYRSYLDSVVRINNTLVFSSREFARVRVEEDDNRYFDGYQLVDEKDNHVWLRFGTDYCDDYYPCFVFEYQPKKA